jgi:serine/threonine-protein kinase
MSFVQFKFVRRVLSLAIILVLVPFTPPIRGDEPALRIANDCVIPLVRIEPGKFDMGRSSRGAFAGAALSFGEQGDWATEGPVRNVTISRAFLIGKYKITAEQYCRFLNSTDGPERFVSINRFSNIENRDGMYHPKDGKSTFPINVVHWDGAKKFCDWLSKKSGRTVRLPTEAEWEYAARGSNGRATPWENKSVMDWSSTEGSPVDAFPDNATPEGVVGLVDYVVGE